MSFASEGRGLSEQAQAAERRKLNVKPLTRLLPYIGRYRYRALAALVALTIAALTTLVVPVAVRRMIDFGFSAKAAELIDSYFSVMIAVVAVLGISFFCMSQALRGLPMGTVYAVWTGIGAAGGMIWGIAMQGEPADLMRVGCICLILAGVAGLKLAG